MPEIVTLQEVYNLTDFATNNLWYMDFIKMPVTPVTMTPNELNMRCSTFTVPSTSVNYIDVTLHNHVKHQPTITKQPDTITIPFIETMDMKTSKWVTSWREICSRTNDNYVSIPSRRRATIQFYTYNEQHQMNYTYRLEYCEITNIGEISYTDGSSPSQILRNVQLKVGAVYDYNL